jgi:hypothetical protein
LPHALEREIAVFRRIDIAEAEVPKTLDDDISDRQGIIDDKNGGRRDHAVNSRWEIPTSRSCRAINSIVARDRARRLQRRAI